MVDQRGEHGHAVEVGGPFRSGESESQPPSHLDIDLKRTVLGRENVGPHGHEVVGFTLDAAERPSPNGRSAAGTDRVFLVTESMEQLDTRMAADETTDPDLGAKPRPISEDEDIDPHDVAGVFHPEESGVDEMGKNADPEWIEDVGEVFSVDIGESYVVSDGAQIGEETTELSPKVTKDQRGKDGRPKGTGKWQAEVGPERFGFNGGDSSSEDRTEGPETI